MTATVRSAQTTTQAAGSSPADASSIGNGSPSASSPPPPARIDARTVRSAVALLREPFWARVALVVVLLSVAFYYLGRWQLGRHEGVVAENTLIQTNYSAAPVPLDTLLPTTTSTLPTKRQWTPVRVTGVYEPQHEVVIRNRPLNDSFGFEVIVPLRLASGAALLIDRGWVAPGPNTVDPGPIPPPPSGQVTVVARVRPGEPSLDRAPPPGQELRIDLGRLASVAGGPVYRGAYGLLAGETPAAAQTPAPLPEPIEDLGMHLAYAIQWWIGDVAAYVMLGRYALREVSLRAAAEQPPTEGEAGGPPDDGAVRSEPATGTPAQVPDTAPPASAPGAPRPPAPVPGPTRIPASLRSSPWASRRRGPTDEDYEDAACE